MSNNEVANFKLGGLVVSTPKNWQVINLIMVGPADTIDTPGVGGGPQGQFQQNLVMVTQHLEQPESIESFVEKQTKNLQDEGALFRRPSPLEHVELKGKRPAAILEHVVFGPGGEKVRQMQLISIKDLVVHAVIVSHMDGLPFESCRDSFRDILLSIQIP